MHRGVPVFLYLSSLSVLFGTVAHRRPTGPLKKRYPQSQDGVNSARRRRIHAAHLERSLQELGQTVVHQQREIAAIMARHRELQQQLEALEGNEAQSEHPFERPPHY